MFNKTLLIGNLTNDVEFAGNGDGKVRAVLNLATNTFWYAEGERQKTTDFHRVVAFGPQAQRVKDLRKGQQVFVEGRSQTRSFTMICSVEYRFPPILGLLSLIHRSRKLTLRVDQILEARPVRLARGRGVTGKDRAGRDAGLERPECSRSNRGRYWGAGAPFVSAF